QIALGLEGGSILVRDRLQGGEIARLQGHGGPVLNLSFAADGKRMASADRDGEIQIWQMSSDGAWACQRQIQINPCPMRTSRLLESRSLPAFGASTLGLLGSLQGPLFAVSVMFPEATEPTVAV